MALKYTSTVTTMLLMSMYQVTVSEIVTEIGPSTMQYHDKDHDLPYSQVIGYDSASNLIWLIGGRTYYRDYIDHAQSFNVSQWDGPSPFINHRTPSFLPHRPRIQCWSQCSVTLGDSIYFLDHYNNGNGRKGYRQFDKYKMSEPQSYEWGWNGVEREFGWDFNVYSCLLLMDDQYLIITGRDDNAGIYDMNNNEWITNVPSMNIHRSTHSCALNPKTKMVYVFGGTDYDSGRYISTDTIEKLDVSNLNRMARQSWIMLNATISGASSGHRAVFHRGLVYIIATPAGVDIFDVNTEECYVYGELAISVSAPAVIKVEPRIYIFGGVVNRDIKDTWQYITLDNARGSAAGSEISEMVSNDHDNDNNIIEFSKKNVSGLSNTQLFLAFVFGNTLIILSSVAIGVCIGKKMKPAQKYQFEAM